jgi:glycosyltransferase involved in cell wall biosynthesis
MKRKILMGCSNYWGSPFQVGSHHIARAFVKMGWDVAFVSDPISPLHFLECRTESLNERFTLYRSGLSEVELGIQAYVPATLLPPHNKPILRTKYIHQNWHKFTFPSLQKILRKNGFAKVDIIYLDNPIHAGLLEVIDYDKSVLRIADKMSGFSKHTPAMGFLEEFVAQEVDLVAYTSESLYSHVESLVPKRSIYFPNGVNVEHFRAKNSPEPVDISRIPYPRVIYIGAMHEWFDFDLINSSVAALPNVSFILIGPKELAVKNLSKAKNLHLLGPRSYSSLPAYLKYSDLGIIPFNVEKYKDLIEHVNPLKLLEYLASGLPVISIKWQELNKFEGIVKLVNKDNFAESIASLLIKGKDGVSSTNMNFAKNYDWLYLAQKLLDQIQSVGHKSLG